MDRAALDRTLLAAHDDNDLEALVRLYRRAGEQDLAAGHVDQGCFYLVHAYIYALDCGHTDAGELREILVTYGREE